MKFAVVDTLHFGDHKMYTRNAELTEALGFIGFEWANAGQFCKDSGLNEYDLGFKPNEDVAIIDTEEIPSWEVMLEILADSSKNKIYIDLKKHVIVPTAW
uniref:hypothetical protein n=1 Tax=Lactobacillus acidophilus TaxID=1579 RepID=UPI003F5764FE